MPTTEIVSPFAPTPNQLAQIVFADIYGDLVDQLPLSRAQAMKVPALARSRHLVAGTIGGLPLRVFRDDVELPDQPSWTVRADHGLPPYHRLLWTVDDLIFYGWSLWAARRGADDALLEGSRIPIERWKFDANGRIIVNDRAVDDDTVVLIPGPHEGLLAFGSTAIRQAFDLEGQASDRAANPHASIDLHYTGDKPMTDAEIDTLINRWVVARKGTNGGVGFSNKNVEVRELGAAAEQLLIEGRNAAAVNMARLVSIPATMVDATAVKASLEYETSKGRNAEFIDYGLSLYMDPITSRLSMDDVVPRGQSVRFDTSTLRDLAPSPTGPITED